MISMMAPLPQPLGNGEIRFWRIDEKCHAKEWNQGIGSYRHGGRWNERCGTCAVYLSLDPSTTIVEMVVQKGVRALDIEPHVITSARIVDPNLITVINREDIPNRRWLMSGETNPNMRKYGEKLLKMHDFIAISSAATMYS